MPSWVGVERWGHSLLGAFCGPLLQGRALGKPQVATPQLG